METAVDGKLVTIGDHTLRFLSGNTISVPVVAALWLCIFGGLEMHLHPSNCNTGEATCDEFYSLLQEGTGLIVPKDEPPPGRVP